MIPLVPASGKRGSFTSGYTVFNGKEFFMERTEDLKVALKDAYDSTEDDDPILLLDVDGLNSRLPNSEIIKEVRIRGRDLIFVTHIGCEDDAIGALTGAFTGLCVPMHTCSRELMLDIREMSDCIYPAAFMKNGKEISTNMIRPDIEVMMKRLGFPRMVFIDTDHMSADGAELTISMISAANDDASSSNP